MTMTFCTYLGANQGNFSFPEIMAGRSLRPPADVYAFAMLCYEVVSHGLYPFAEIKQLMAVSSFNLGDPRTSTDPFQQLIYTVGVEQKRPALPEGVPDKMWKLMEACWAHDPEARPKFDEVRDRLEVISRAQ
jgi:abelson tyrosine-protein kinase 1